MRKGFSKLDDDVSSNSSEQSILKMPRVKVHVYDENEETTCIEVAELLTASKLKQWVVAPILSLLSLLVWPVFLYWYKTMQRDWLYRPATSIDSATHLYIEGRDGNKEIVRVKNFTERSNSLINRAQEGDPDVKGLSIFFTYRFINFEWNEDSFVPIKFRVEGLAYDQLR